MHKLLLLANILVVALCDHHTGHHDDSDLPAACHMPPDKSDCGGKEVRWFYHPSLKACTKFTYKGCGKSANSFVTKLECEKLCSSANENGESTSKEETEVVKEKTITTSEKMEESKSKDKNKGEFHAKVVEFRHGNDEKHTSGEKTQENTDHTEEEEKDSKEMDETNKKIENGEETVSSEEEEDDIQTQIDEQEEIEKRFNMADANDLLTLEQYMQDENMDVGDLVNEDEAGDILDSDIKGRLYESEEDFKEDSSDEDEQDKNLSDSEKKIDEGEQQTSKDTNLSEQNESDEEDENANLEEKQSTLLEGEVENDEPQNEESEDEEIEEPEEYVQDLLNEEDELQKRFSMANSEDMFALQEIMQSPGMEVEEPVEPSTKLNKEPSNEEEISQENINEGPTSEKDLIQEEQKEPSEYEYEKQQEQGTYEDDIIKPYNEAQNDEDMEEDEDISEAEKRREQFSMADNGDYMTLEELMANPQVEEMEIIQEKNGDYGQGGDIRIAHMHYESDDGSVQHTMQQIEQANSNDSKEEEEKDNYNEHLDKSPESHAGEGDEDEIEATLNFEKELEQRFNMADREDLLSLEGIIQDSNTNLAELIPADKVSEKQDSDINGVLTLAASFLGEDNKEESKNLEDLHQNINQLPEIAREPLKEAGKEINNLHNGRFELLEEKNDYTHPAERLENENKFKQSVFPPLEIKAMGHDDKMMLMSLLHIDRLKVHKLAGTTPPVLSPLSDEKEVEDVKLSPKPDFLKTISTKYGVKKCCLLPKDPGPCKNNRVLQWHYDPVLRTCLPFFYGGCKGNKNRFDTIGECLRICGMKPQEVDESLPEPIPEPPVSVKNPSPPTSLKSMISKILPGKILSLKEKMSPGQQKFIHKFIKSALSHVSDMKPVKISHFPVPISGFSSHENAVDVSRRDRLPMPIKSIIFKWPILRMVFDKKSKEMQERSKFREDRFPQLPIEKIFPSPPREFNDLRGFGKDWGRENRDGFKEYKKMGKEWGRDRSDFKEYRRMGKDWRRDQREDFRKMGKDWGREYRKNGQDWGREKDDMHSKHFSPTFKKSYKMMSHHEDNRHQISSDPKNKVNLIQVFVNKPHTESHSNPSHHHTMIKKEYSAVEPKVHSPRPIPPALPPPSVRPSPYPQKPQTYPGPYGPPHSPPQNPRPYPPNTLPNPPPQPHQQPNIQPLPNQIPQLPPTPHYHHHHFDYHHHHPPHSVPNTHYHMHSHPHPPIVPNYGPPPPFFQLPRPWWSRFDKPYFEPHFNENRRNGVHPSARPITRHPEERHESLKDETEDNEHVMIVTVPQTESDNEVHYACLLPVSTGLCKAFMEKYYFNKATGTCDMFIYGGCGGNANNFETKAECEATCIKPSASSNLDDTTTLPDDTLIITSPVYVPQQREEDTGREQTEKVPSSSETEDNETEEKENNVKIENAEEVLEAENEKEKETEKEHDAVKIEPVSLFQSSNTEYIIVVTVMCFVGLSAVVLVALAIANLSRRLSRSKKEKVIEAVLSSHLDARSSGSLTPRMSFYGQPPSEMGPPPISEVLKIHNKEKTDQEV